MHNIDFDSAGKMEIETAKNCNDYSVTLARMTTCWSIEDLEWQ